MNASKLIDNLIAKLTDWRGVTFAAVRKVIREADPEIVEEWKWMGSPVWSHDGIVCVANAFKDKVKVTFYEGASLPDRTSSSTTGSTATSGDPSTSVKATWSMRPRWQLWFVRP
jgi:hypothetical protein